METKISRREQRGIRAHERAMEDGARSMAALQEETREKVQAAAAAMGRAGCGASKVRGDSDHYRALVAKRKDRGCFYCERRPATREAIYEPTDRGTYAPTTRVICSTCAETYRRPPFGFRVE